MFNFIFKLLFIRNIKKARKFLLGNGSSLSLKKIPGCRGYSLDSVIINVESATFVILNRNSEKKEYISVDIELPTIEKVLLKVHLKILTDRCKQKNIEGLLDD